MTPTKALDKPLVTAPERAREADADSEIVRRVQAGDVAAFDELILKYRQRLYAVVYNLTSNREDASDLVQDSFIKAFQSINRFGGQSSFFTWLYRIAINSTLSHLRKKYPVQFRHGLRLRDYPTLRSWVGFVMEAARNHGALSLPARGGAVFRAADPPELLVVDGPRDLDARRRDDRRGARGDPEPARAPVLRARAGAA